MNMRQVCLFVMSLCLAPCPLPHAPLSAAPHVEQRGGLAVVYLEGSPYELGKQHGELLRDDVRAMVGRTLAYVRSYLKVPLVKAWLGNWWLDQSWAPAKRFVPNAYLEELRGLADGSGVPLRELWRLHALPDRTYACSNLAAWGRATADGRLIHVRNLDWNIGIGVQRYAIVFVVRPAGRHAFVNVGWAGFIGALTGINDQQLSIGQIGAATVEVTARGVPMAFLIRRVLEDAGTVDEAAAIITGARRTVGTNYVIADAKAKRAVAIETNRKRAEVFQADDPREHDVLYARPIADAVLRSDTAMDPLIRDRQTASKGDPNEPGLEPPRGSAYEIRYLKQVELLERDYGRLTPERARLIAQTVAPESNIQSVIFAWPDAWIANAQDRTPAAQREYHRLDVSQLLEAAR